MEIEQIAVRFRIIGLKNGEKSPFLKGWANRFLSPEAAAQHVAAGGNVGLLLGPTSGIDVDFDGPTAEADWQELTGGAAPATPGWRSTRGRHLLFAWDDRFARLPAFFKWRGLEFRIGTGPAQSVIPPSIVDGVERQWDISLADADPAPLPDELIEKILELGAKQSKPRAEQATRRPATDKLLAYFKARGIPCRVEHKPETAIVFGHCPIKGPEHRDGGALIYVNDDNSEVFDCKHASCRGKTLDDVYSIHGLPQPVIRIGADMDRVVDEACAALGGAQNVYQRSVLVRLKHDAAPPPNSVRQAAAPRLEPIPIASLCEELSSVARCEKWNERKGEYVRCPFPESIAKAVDARAQWPSVRVIEGIIGAPVLLPDGSILTEPGYHAPSGLYLESTDSYPPLPSVPDAVALLLSAIADFPATDVYKAGWIAMLLTLFARHAFSGPAPLGMIEANIPGAGKTLLADVLATTADRRQAARCSVPTKEDEWGKLISAIAIAAPPFVLLDNAKGRFGSPALDKVLTGCRWQDRLLGFPKMINVPMNVVWIATGNNTTLSADTARRTLHIRLDSPLERPAERTNFQHPDLLAWVRAERPRLVAAALAILKGYVEAGRPNQNLPAWGSFEGWSDLVRSAVVWAKLPDPGETRAALAEHADDDSAVLRELLAAWPPGPTKVKEAIELTDHPDFERLKAVIGELQGDPSRALGALLRDSRGRVIGGKRFVSSGNGIKKWSVEAA